MSWSNILTASQFNGYTSKTLAAVRNVKATICARNWFYVQCLATDDTLWVGRTPNRGDTWFFSNVGTVTETDIALGFAVSQHDALKCWSCGADGVLKASVDGAVSFSTLYTVPSAAGPINNIEVPYADNPTDQIIYIGGYNATGGTSLTLPCIADTFIDDAADDTNYGSYTYWRTAEYDAANMDKRTLLKFSLAGIDSGATITSARIYHYVYQDDIGLSAEWYVYLVTETWNEYAVTWANAPGYGAPLSRLWQDGGTGWKEWNALGAVQDIVDGSEPNHGFFCRRSTPDQGVWSRSREYADSDYHPYLVILGTGLPGSFFDKSTNGGGAFSDVAPSEGAPDAFAGMEVATLDGQTIYALVRSSDTEEHHAVVSVDAAANWTEKSDFNSIAPADADGQASLGAWPFDVNTMYALQHRNPGGVPTNMILSTADLAANWADKSGDWATAVQAVWGLNKAYCGSCLPVWLP